MPDSLEIARRALINTFQDSMRSLRLLMGYSVAELSEYIGVTRQTINNLETGKSKMSVVQYLSLSAVVDNYISLNTEKYQTVAAILDGGKGASGNYDSSFSGFSLLRRWFLLFEETEVEVMPEHGNPLNDAQIRLLIRGYRVFLDDTALLAEKADEFLHSLERCLIEEGEKLIVPLRSIEKIQQRTQNPALTKQAVKTLRLINWMQQKNLVQIRGEESDSNLSDTILSVFLKFRATHRLCLITQDEAFADEVLQLNETNGRSGFNISVGYISDDGRLALYSTEDYDHSELKDVIPASWTEID